jgi:hypothetical protein
VLGSYPVKTLKPLAPLMRLQVIRHDGPMRMIVPSRTPKEPPYLVQLDAYDGNGTCQCKHFVCRLEPLLKKGMTGQQAFDAGADVPEWSGFTEDCLRCFHIHAARLKFADDTIRAISDAEHAVEGGRRDPF